MATCPVCGTKVPFGGGRTVKNARLMYELARVLEANVDDEQERQFVREGVALADSLHAYGHRNSMVNPGLAVRWVVDPASEDLRGQVVRCSSGFGR